MWQKKDSGKSKKDSKDDGKDPKKYIDNHPARQVNKDQMQVVAGQGQPDWARALSEQILVYHESEPLQSNGWMSQLKEDSAHFLAEQRGVHLQQIYRETLYKKGIEMLVDKIFALLQRYTYEFNQVASGTDLHVSGTISGETTEVLRYNKFREAEETKSFFRARFSTRLMSLAIRGREDHVDFYLVPANRSMALSKCENEYKPVSRLQVRITDQGMMWRMSDGVPAVESLEQLCMWLFSGLITETKAAAKLEAENEGTA